MAEKITIEEYKKMSKRERIKKLSFPSGLEFEIELPKASEVLKALAEAGKTTEAKAFEIFLKLIEKKFPEGLTIDDLTWKDFSYLSQVVKGFFDQTI